MKKTRLIPNAKVLILAPVFAFLTACGGGNYDDPAFDAPAEMLSSKPANYTPEAASVAESDTAGAADAAIAADVAARAAAPAEATASDTAPAQAASSSTVASASAASESSTAAVPGTVAAGTAGHAVVIIAPPAETKKKRNAAQSGIIVLTAPSVNPAQAPVAETASATALRAPQSPR